MIVLIVAGLKMWLLLAYHINIYVILFISSGSSIISTIFYCDPKVLKPKAVNLLQ